MWVWSVYDTLKLGQVHVFIATLPDTAYGSHSQEYHYFIPRTARTANFYIQNLKIVSIGADAR